MRFRTLALPAVACGLIAACTNPFQVAGNGAAPTANGAAPVGNGERTAIQRVLDEDNRAGTSSSDPRQIHAQMQRIDLSGTPADFRSAFQVHMDAWRDAGALVTEGEGMADADDARRRDWTDRVGRAEGRIADTFTEVTRIAARYGANPPATSGRSGLGGTVEGRGGSNAATPAPAPAPEGDDQPLPEKPSA